MTECNCQEYYGYPNRETYDMALWLSNEYYTQKALEEMAVKGITGTDVQEFYESLEDFVPEHYAAIRNDVGSVWRVDWEHIAENYAEAV